MKTINAIFDLDDTLVECGKHYRDLRTEFGIIAAKRIGMSSQLCTNTLIAIDNQCSELPDAWGRNRFPRSFYAASLVLDVLAGKPLDLLAAQDAENLGRSVFAKDYALLGDIHTSLAWFASRFNMFLYTKGDPEHQMRKVEKTSLLSFFPLDHIHIVPHKNTDQLWEIVHTHKLKTNMTLMVGDSFNDDMVPANTIGMQTAWIIDNSDHSYHGDFGNVTYSLHSIHDLISALEEDSKHGLNNILSP